MTVTGSIVNISCSGAAGGRHLASSISAGSAKSIKTYPGCKWDEPSAFACGECAHPSAASVQPSPQQFTGCRQQTGAIQCCLYGPANSPQGLAAPAPSAAVAHGSSSHLAPCRPHSGRGDSLPMETATASSPFSATCAGERAVVVPPWLDLANTSPTDIGMSSSVTRGRVLGCYQQNRTLLRRHTHRGRRRQGGHGCRKGVSCWSSSCIWD